MAIAALRLVQESFGDSFTLVQTNPPAFYGPYEYRHGETIVIDTNSYILVTGRHDFTPSENRARRILFPALDFRDARFEDVVAYLRDNAYNFDPQATGVNIIILAEDPNALGPQATKRITLNLKRVSLYDALRYAATLAGFDISADAETLFIVNPRKSLTVQQGDGD